MSYGLSVLGSVNLDLIVQLEQLPKAGETITGGTYSALPGGKGANVAVAARRLGAETEILAAVGDDDYAQQALVNLEVEGVYLDAVRKLDAHTGLAFISVAADGENQIAVASGANAAYAPEHLPKLCSDVLVTQFEIPVETIRAALDGYEGTVIVNASPVREDVADILARADVVIVNEGEASQYDLRDHKGLVCVTLGAHGAELRRDGNIIATAQPPAVEVVDTTGAGDAFAAGLTVGLAEGMADADALRFACAVGALTATQLGTQTASPTRAEVDAILAR
jgi:ribokinase